MSSAVNVEQVLPFPTGSARLSSRVTRLFERAFEAPHSSGRIIPMEGLRAFAALLVFLAHFHTPFEGRLQHTHWLYSAAMIGGLFGQAGVDVFFVLSGYLMYGATIKSRRSYGSFLGRRVLRIYPVFTAVFILYIFLSIAFPFKSKIPSGSGGVLFLAYNFFMLPGVFPLPELILPAWSLSYEWLFYLSMPLVVAGLRMRNWLWWKRLAFFGVLSAAIAVFGIWSGLLQHNRLALFGVGIAIWELNTRYELRSKLSLGMARGLIEWPLIALLAVNLIALGVAQFGGAPDSWPWFWTPSLCLTLLPFIAYTLFGGGVLTSIFSWAPLRWIGNFSYSYYLIHSVTIQGLKLVVDKYFPGNSSVAFIMCLFVTALAATLAAGALLYLCVERPLQVWAEPKGKASREVHQVSSVGV
jgi:exopolysaccharide production protein ExoZ